MKNVFVRIIVIFHLGMCHAVHINLLINTTSPIFIMDELSPSVALGSAIFKYRLVDYMNSSKLLTLAKGLGPCYLRLGGTRSDHTTFNPEAKIQALKPAVSGSCNEGVDLNPILDAKLREIDEATQKYALQKSRAGILAVDNNVTFTGKQWDKLNNFTRCVNWKLIFGLNFLTKQKNGSWDPTNAEEIFAYSEKRKYKIDWELGNEPNSFLHKSGISFTPEQLADGFLRLRPILNKYSYKDALIIGPDTNNMFKQPARKYFKSFIVAAKPVIDRITFHQYYTNGSAAKLANFTDPKLLNNLNILLKKTKRIADKVAPNIPIWLGETSSTFGGGTPNISNTFANGFMWLNKLGMSAKLGVSMVIRQTFFEGNYALLDAVFNPRPDYWLTVLYKRLVGPKVFDVKLSSSEGKISREYGNIRVFAHCAKETKHVGGLTIYFLNLSNKTLVLKMPQIGGKKSVAHEYLLTHGEGGLTSKDVLLNGKLLKLLNNTTMPKLNPKKVTYKGKININMMKKSFGFVVFPNADISACFDETSRKKVVVIP